MILLFLLLGKPTFSQNLRGLDEDTIAEIIF